MVDIALIRDAVKKIVKDAEKDGSLDALTPRVIRRRTEEHLDLAEGDLDDAKYKTVIKAAIEEAMAEPADANEAHAQESKPKPAPKGRKRKSDGAAPEEKPEKKAKTAVKPRAKKSEAAEGEKKKRGSAKKVRSPSVVPSDSEGEAGPSKKVPAKKSKTSFRSASVIPTDSEGEAHTKVSPPKKANKPLSKASATAETAGTSSPSRPPRSKPDAPEAAIASKTEDPAGDKSESEMSILIDEPPKRGKKKSKETKAKKEPTKRRTRAPAEELSKEDQEIKRLKSFVLACGVRKAWAKEFKTIPDDKRAQIKRIKDILAELGMTGRLSMDVAKQIKEKRELAQELEDVTQFDKAVNNTRRASRSKPDVKPVTEDDDAEMSEVDALPRRRARTAHKSIMDFLGDQSDDE